MDRHSRDSAAGTFTEVEPSRRVVFTCGWEGWRRCRRRVDRGRHAEPAAADHGPPDARGLLRRQGQPRRGWTHYLAGWPPRPPPGRQARRVGDQPDLDSAQARRGHAGHLQRILGRREDDYHKATVCTEFDVTQLADHPDRIGHVPLCCRARRAGAGPAPVRWRRGSPQRPGHARRAWHVRGLDGTVKVGPRGCPASAALGILSMESWSRIELRRGHRAAGLVSDEVGQHPRPGPPDRRAGSRGRRSFADPIEAGPTLACSTGSSPSPAEPLPSRGNRAMPERTSYTQGTPNWVDLPTSDQAAAKAFYAGLFGSTSTTSPSALKGRGRCTRWRCSTRHQVAAVSSRPAEMATAAPRDAEHLPRRGLGGQRPPPRVEAAGGEVAMAPFRRAGRPADVLRHRTRPARRSRCGRPAAHRRHPGERARHAQLERARHQRPARRSSMPT